MEPSLENLTNTPLPDHMPVMVLPECHLFPGCLLPLYIFEERYREMLAQALRTNRMFCIGNRIEDSDEVEISPHSTAGLVRCCVRQEDGTSHLLLLGLQRIKFTGWLQEMPFRVATIEPVITTISDPKEAERLKLRALELFTIRDMECAQQLREMLMNNDNAELVCDVLSYHFTRCPKLQQMLLAEASLERRFELLIKALEKHKCD
jgi:Lon protease-like protein